MYKNVKTLTYYKCAGNTMPVKQSGVIHVYSSVQQKDKKRKRVQTFEVGRYMWKRICEWAAQETLSYNSSYSIIPCFDSISNNEDVACNHKDSKMYLIWNCLFGERGFVNTWWKLKSLEQIYTRPFIINIGKLQAWILEISQTWNKVTKPK